MIETLNRGFLELDSYFIDLKIIEVKLRTSLNTLASIRFFWIS